MPIVAQILIAKALSSGNMAITQGHEGYTLSYRWCGMWLTLASVTQEEFKVLTRPNLTTVK
jgi:hypothetical protein